MKPRKCLSVFFVVALVSLLFPAGWFVGTMEVRAAEMFYDDFEDGTASDWTVVNGSWSVVTENGNHVYKQTDTSGEGLAVSGEASWNDYAVEANLTVYDLSSTDASRNSGPLR